jgi:hypothetical protein
MDFKNSTHREYAKKGAEVEYLLGITFLFIINFDWERT